MKKIIIIFSLIVSGFLSAQSDNPYIYDQPDETSEMQDKSTPAGPGDPGAAPINEYVPFLFMVAAVLAFTASYKKKAIEKN
ncbi:hypothetical protein [uncultured Chryseobacterium sp.]|uniref:hypothetical protein n=1 Tax=uncultured Chryseobacterium sp. TaxID=259322 RepID=UPI0025F6C294|nr:hypothetical protein [uncultured Chryseobacterium sp.]